MTEGEALPISSFFEDDHSPNSFGINISLKASNAVKICDWLIFFGGVTFVFILVTLISDWNTVFYRKAIIYRRRVDDELANKRLQNR
jgi:hypothetical protein